MGITSHEQKAVLALREQFSADPIVFDIGSNKGEWADILIRNVKEMHLFEPNDRLLSYTMVKYDDLTNVIYNELAVCSSHMTRVKFDYFTDTHNGLSNIYGNPKWLYLKPKSKLVQTCSLDMYWNGGTIDFIKIDCEGADFEVLLGAERLLKEKKIKFIQIEKSEHYAVAGHTFEDVIKFVRQFGYEVYNFDGYWFEPIGENTEAENYYIMAQYTQDWNAEFKKNTSGIRVETALEIGCFEGLTTNYICDNLLKEGGRVICVDPLENEYLPGHKDNEMFVGQFERFARNTAGRPVELIRKKSNDAFQELKDLRFGLIYIDGDHTEESVFNDGVMYWNVLLDTPRGSGGFMLFDDYGQSEETKRGIDRFLETQKGNYKLIVKDYQVLIRRLW